MNERHVLLIAVNIRDSSGTTLYCYGNCLIVCDSNETNNDCVEFVVPVSPTTQLTKSQIIATQLTRQDVSLWFNWVLGYVVSFVVLIIIIDIEMSVLKGCKH